MVNSSCFINFTAAKKGNLLGRATKFTIDRLDIADIKINVHDSFY